MKGKGDKMTSKYNINGFAFEDFKVIGDNRVLYSFGNYKDDDGDTFEIHVEYNRETKEFEFEKLYLEDLSEPCFLDIYPEDLSPEDMETLKQRVLEKVKELEAKEKEQEFEDTVINLLANGAEITTREALIKFAEDMETVNRELSNHIYDALEQNYALYYKYDFEMGIEETPVELTCMEDLNEFFEENEELAEKGFYIIKYGDKELSFSSINDFLDEISEIATAFEENGEKEFKIEIKC